MTVRVARRSGAHSIVQGLGRWSPALLGVGLIEMWDAERPQDLDLSGSAVVAWRSARNGYSAGQSVGAARPVYSATSFNGGPGVSFDGADDELTYVGALAGFPLALAGCEMWFLLDQKSLAADTTARYPASFGNVSFSSVRGLRRSVGTGVNRFAAITGNTGTQAVNNAVDASGRLVCRVVFDGTNKRVDINGVAGATTVMETTGSPDRFRLGAAASSPAGGFLSGVLACTAVTALLTPNEATQMLAYLKARGGIP